MPQIPTPAVQANFTGGLKTEFTALNFPPNSATDTENCVYTLIGDVTRRAGFDFESNYTTQPLSRTNLALSSYKWNNVGGDGLTQVVVKQVGGTLYFYKSSSATISNPLSTQLLVSTVAISSYVALGGSFDSSVECQYTDGNGYLFVFHPSCDPFYATYNAGTITGNPITVQSRDFTGIPETGVADNFRPNTLSSEHQYNLQNQGWNNKPTWVATSGTVLSPISGGSHTFVTQSGLSITNGDSVSFSMFVQPQNVYGSGTGTVTAYSGTSLTMTINPNYLGFVGSQWTFNSVSSSANTIPVWHTQVGSYPSNADVWWQFKDSTNVFAPSTTIGQVTLGNAPAPKGSYILNAFSQLRSGTSGITGLTDITTTSRPRTGAWFQGRVWYSGVDATFASTGDAPYTTWTENIYFSQIVQGVNNFGRCYQTNDPTSENLFDLLPTDGGVIVIQGSGSIYKLFPVQTGLFVFAANGVWFIAGSAGVGFAANDYTVIKVSGVQSISGTSFINVLGWPVFWNEEGIYEVVPSGQSDTQNNRRNFFSVNNLCLGSILTYYSNIPLQSKKFVRGDYNPLDFLIQWTYRSTNESTVTSRYEFDSILNFNTSNKAFYPYQLSPLSTTPFIHDIKYVAGPGGTNSPMPVFKYNTSQLSGGQYFFTFSEERDTTYTDWVSASTPTDYTSYFVTGYNILGKAINKFQTSYVYTFSRNPANQFYIQSIWDYAISGNSGRWSVKQLITNNNSNFSTLYRRHRLRGRGLSMQIKVTSVTGQPFDLMGWTVWSELNQGI